MHFDRFNLTNAPQEFVVNKTVNDFVSKKGVEGLPVIIVDGEIGTTNKLLSAKASNEIEWINQVSEHANGNFAVIKLETGRNKR